MIVYIYTFPNGKKYIGQTINSLNERAKNGEGYINSPAVYNAIKKYGWNNLKIQTYDCSSKEEMDSLEKYFIRLYNTTDSKYGYNLTLGGDGVPKYDREEIKKLWLSKRSIKEIALKFNCQNETIRNALIGLGLYDEKEDKERYISWLSKKTEGFFQRIL